MPGVTSHPDFSALLKFSLRCQRKFSGVMQVDGVGFTLQGPTQGGDRLGHLIHASRRAVTTWCEVVLVTGREPTPLPEEMR